MSQGLKTEKIFPRRSLSDSLSADVQWFKTQDPTVLWCAQVGPDRWTLRVNDFPEEHPYTFFANDQELGSFNEWPSQWSRAEDVPNPGAP